MLALFLLFLAATRHADARARQGLRRCELSDPGGPERDRLGRVSGELRYRYFGPRPLVEDSVRSSGSNLVNARVGYRVAPRVRLDIDVFNVLEAKASDIDYFYASRLPALRVGVTTSF